MQRFIIPLKNITILKTLILFLLVCLNSCSRKDLNNPVDQKLINRKETIEKFLKAPSNSSIGLKLLINDIKKTEEKYQFLYEFAKRNGIPNWNAVESNYSNTNLNINEVNQIRSNSIESTNGGTGEIYFIPLIDSISNEVSSYIYCTKDRNGFYKYKTYNKKAILLSTAKDSSDVKKKGMLLSVFAHFERKIYKKNILNFSYPYNYEFNNVNLEFPASELNYSNNLKSASTDSKYKSNSSGCPDHFDIKILIGNSIVPAGSIFRFYINCDGKIITWHVIWPHFPIGGSPTNPPTVPIQNPPPNSNPNPPNLVLNNPPLFVPYFPYTPNPNTINVGGSSGSSPNGNQGSSLPPNWIEDPNDPWMPQNPVIDEIDMPNYSNSPLVFDPNDPWKDIADIIYSPDIPIIENGTYIEDVNDDSAEYQIPGLRKIGSTPPRNNSEDTTHGTNGNTDGIIPFFQTMTDDELFDEMKNLFHITTFFSPYTLRKTGEKMIQKFKNGPKQPPFSDKDLNNHVKYSSAINNFTKEFGSILAAQLKITSGDINKINQIDIPQSVRPIFNGLFNKFNGLQILVNDTEQTEVYLKNYQIDTNGNWEAEIVIEITDHFGLDKNDALNYQYKHSGFGAWWTLQFKRDYKPFITKIHVGKIIKGKI